MSSSCQRDAVPSRNPGGSTGARVGRIVLIFGALAVLVVAAVVEGGFSNRWGVREDSQLAAAKVKKIPAAFGDWTSVEHTMDQKILDVAEANGSLSRTYTNKKTGVVLSILTLCGPTGPIGAHTPDICYAGIGYQMKGSANRKTIVAPDGSTSTFWSGRFSKGNGDPDLVVDWGWGVDGNWVASDSPRSEFALRDLLYKLYISRIATPDEQNGKSATDPTKEFLLDFLIEVKKVLAQNSI